MSARPHIRDFFASYRFSVGVVAATDGGAWVGDGFLPLVVWVDAETWSVSGPYLVDQGEGRRGQMRAMVVAEGSVWFAWDHAIGRFDPQTRCTTCVLPAQRWELAAGQGAVWTLSGDGTVVRCDCSGKSFDRIGEPESHRSSIAIGHESVWTLGGSHAHARTVLTRLDPRTGRVEARLELNGQPASLTVDSTGVWASVIRRVSPRDVTIFVQHVDPQRDQLVGEWEATGVSLSAVRNGVLWTPVSPAEPDLPAAMNRLSASSGELFAATAIEGRLSRPVAGESGVWACLRRGPICRHVVRFTDSGEPTVIDLGGVDIGGHRPPAPPPIDAEKEERELRAKVETILTVGWTRTDPDTGRQTTYPYIRGIAFEAVALEGTFPDTNVVIYFRSDQHPGVLFGRRRRIWHDSGALTECDAGVITINLMEHITACGHGLPIDPATDPTRITWF